MGKPLPQQGVYSRYGNDKRKWIKSKQLIKQPVKLPRKQKLGRKEQRICQKSIKSYPNDINNLYIVIA